GTTYNQTEFVSSKTCTKSNRLPVRKRLPRKGGGRMRKATAGAFKAATSIGSAIAKRAPLGAAEAKVLFMAAFALIGLALLFVFFPRGASIPVIALLLILAIPTLIKAIQNYRNS